MTQPALTIPRNDTRILMYSLAAASFIVSAIFGILSAPDGLLQFDDLTHYLFARWAWTWPAYLLDDWGRPGFTALYFLPAGIGWTACRLLSALLSAASALLASRIAERLSIRHAWAVIPLVFAQPLYFQLSQTTLTETAMAFYLVLAVYLATKKRWTASSAVLSLAFVTRHEGIIFLPVWLYFARCQQVPIRRLWPLLWAPLVVNVLSPILDLRPPITLFFDPARQGQYGRGGWLTYFCRALEAWGPGITLLAMCGLTSLWQRLTTATPAAKSDATISPDLKKQQSTGRLSNPSMPGGRLVVACIGIYFIAQTVVRALGLYDSGGYARFLVPISPLIGIAALAGWQRMVARDTKVRGVALMTAAASMFILWIAMERQLLLHEARTDDAGAVPDLYAAKLAVRTATAVVVVLALTAAWAARIGRTGNIARYGLVSMVTILIVLAVYALCHPLRPPPEAPLVDEARRQLAAMGFDDREIISAVVWIDYVTQRSFPPQREKVRRELELAPVGTLFAWEQQFAGSLDHGLALEEFTQSPSFRLVLQSPPLPGRSTPYLHIFEKIGPWP